MAQPIRIEFGGALYHEASRGDQRELTFEDAVDREQFLEMLGNDRRVGTISSPWPGYTIRNATMEDLTLLGSEVVQVIVAEQRVSPNAAGTGTTYLHTDALGSVVAETDEAGAVTHHHYEPYGAPTDQTYTQEPGYTGHVMDAATGLVYMQQRYMDPLAGRFISVDPARSGFNPYAYANNNPYRYIDPDGRKITTVSKTQRQKVAKLINSQTSKQYKFDEGGNLVATGKMNDGGSDTYSAAVDKAIGSKVNVQIGFAQDYKLPGNQVKSIDEDNGGGLTSKVSSKLIKIRTSGNSVRFRTIGGKMKVDQAQDILRHEIVGHAVPLIGGFPRANSIDLDNATRRELGRPLLRSDPKHTAETW